MDTLIRWGIYAAMAAAVAGVLYGAWYTVDHWCNASCERETARADKAKKLYDDTVKAMVAAKEKRDAEHKQEADTLRALASNLEAQRQAALASASARAAERDRVARDLEAYRGRCVLPDDARVVWNAAASADARPADVRPTEAGKIAPDAKPGHGVDCVDVHRIGTLNTEDGRFNGEALDRCWAYAIPLWEQCTGQRFRWEAK